MDGPLLLYDGDCGLCHGVVRWVLRHEQSPEIRFLSLQSPTGRHWADLAGTGLDTLLWVDRGAVFSRSDAVIRMAGHLRRPWRWLGLLQIVPRPLRDAGYTFVARRRHRWFGRPACVLPSEAHRDRFLS